MQAVDDVKSALRPKFFELIEYLDQTEQTAACAFFTNLLTILNAATHEEELLGFFIELSSTAFVGLQFDQEAADRIDHILAYSMEIAETFSVPAHAPH